MKGLIRFFIILLSIVLIVSIAGLFQSGIHFSLPLLFDQFVANVKAFANLSTITYESPEGSGIERSVFPLIYEYYGYSISILLLGFVLALATALMLTMITFYLPKMLRELLKRTMGLLEAVPDIFIIVIVQLAFVSLYKKTGILLFEVVGGFDRPLFLPLVTFSILPSIFLYRIMLLIFEDELSRPYVELARGKGIARWIILLKHIARNSLISVVNHSKSIVTLMLTNLVMLEIIFNLHGITWFIISNVSAHIVMLSIIMIFIPIYIIELVARRLITHFTGEEVPN
ncbi:ABC transporter permease subunit [Pseudalkalibacillus hwajinpoensis]|uniref:ABC transporter permease subunit n=1 Tax=Guptibacillus hwajinpoensis TaxID=208199 RepID=A0A4U1MND7_9BACL|nr:ABC transporter permease subunit [Pseudalkalibacillus hwajinpoensis]TKD72324.1 ABC transporter permease subunit [Pseudalkalibacillus hwajinpoensis]